MRPSRPRSECRLMRLLVFACFFNFSGINNGYTTLTAVAPLNATQSVSVMASLVKSFTFFLTPQKSFSTFKHGRRWMSSLHLSPEKSKISMRRGGQRWRGARGKFAARTGRMERMHRGERQARMERAKKIHQPDIKARETAGLAPIHDEYIKEKESWCKQKEEWSRENWNGLDFHPSRTSPDKDLNAPRMTLAVLAPEAVWDVGGRLKKVLRHLVYPDGGDSFVSGKSGKVCIQFSNPGPVYDRGLFLPEVWARGRFQA